MVGSIRRRVHLAISAEVENLSAALLPRLSSSRSNSPRSKESVLTSTVFVAENKSGRCNDTLG